MLYVVVVSVVIHLNTSCQSGGGVAPAGILLLNTGERAVWRVEERAVEEGSCCRDLSCLTLEHQLVILFFFLQNRLS